MKKLIVGAIAPVVLGAAPAGAHEVWVERDGNGPARVYLGEPADEVQDNAEHDLSTLKPLVFTTDRAKPAALTTRADHIEAAISGPGDVRIHDAGVFKPWTSNNIRQAQVFHGRAGRTETTAGLDFELVPVAAGSDSFTVLLHGKPLAGASVNIISPDKWQKSVKADAAGRVSVPDKGKGRYIVAAFTREDGERAFAGETIARLHHVTTITYVR